MASRKVEGATEEVVACLTDPALGEDLTPREKLALEYLELMATDHHSIGNDTYRRMAEHFTVAEIVELGLTCSHMIGTHRFIHTLDVYGDGEPALRYDPEQVGVTWEQAHRHPVRSE